MNSSKRRKSKKTVAAGVILLTVMLAASACGNTNNAANPGNEQPGTVTEGPVVDLPNKSGLIDPEVPAPEPTEDTNQNGGEQEPVTNPVLSGEGTYIGLMDSHSIEIETADGPMPFQVTDDLMGALEALPENAKVKYEYTEKAIEGETDMKQNWLSKIEEIK
ncbi:hypothetical protein [Paenibacillus sp. sgz302251]|uniref:hypothetical protein n=1 Tax=Paenibacillus sp. sgz302251 TaxID=3414493 RepID=UPI003C7BCFD1